MQLFFQLSDQKPVRPTSVLVEWLLALAIRIAIPVVLSVLLFRFCIVPAGSARDPLARFASNLGNQFPLVFFVGCTVALTGLFGYAWQVIVAPRGASTRSLGSLRAALAHEATRDSSPAANRWKRLREVTITLVVATFAACSALALRSYAFESHRVLSTSMLPSLTTGDQVLVNKVAYGWRRALGIHDPAMAPLRGELVVFNFIDGDDSRKLLLKRVIGTAGDRIKMLGNTPSINGWTVPFCDVGPYANVIDGQLVMGRLVVEFLESHWYLTLHTVTERAAFAGEYVVKPGEVFVLGDHRSESIDSRAWNQGRGGGVPNAAIEGRAERFLVSNSRSGVLDFTRLMQPSDGRLNIEGVDTSALSVSIRRCLDKRPPQTVPPSPQGVPSHS